MNPDDIKERVGGKISRVPKSTYWLCTTIDEHGNNDERYFLYFDGALAYWIQFERYAYYRIRAREIAQQINNRTLSKTEHEFLSRMIAKNWKGCTKRQYGFLRGIVERNKV